MKDEGSTSDLRPLDVQHNSQHETANQGIDQSPQPLSPADVSKSEGEHFEHQAKDQSAVKPMIQNQEDNVQVHCTCRSLCACTLICMCIDG